MAYSDFTLNRIKSMFNIGLVETVSLFAEVEKVQVSEFLTTLLANNVPLAHAISTEKARSEMIIAPILIEVRKMQHNKISLFSGIDFNVDPKVGLNGVCDFIISKSPEQLYLSQPLIPLVEAKNENITSGLPQCLAEMIAARLFNEQQGSDITTIYGCVSTGTIWKFLQLTGETAYIDYNDYYINDVGQLLGIFQKMVTAGG